MSVMKPEIHNINITQAPPQEEEEEEEVPLSIRLRQTLASCSRSIEDGDFSQSEKSMSELVDFLASISDSAASEPDNEGSESAAFEVLSEIHQYITSPSLDQAVMDALSFELPKAVARFSSASNRCLEIAESIIDRFILTCSPRDMLSILCEAMGSPGRMFKTPSYFAPFLSGLAKVFISIQRRHFEQIKAAIPIILRVLKVISSESDDDDDLDSEDLFNRAICVANSIQAVCVKLEAKARQKLSALFGLFILQIMALASVSTRGEVSSRLPLMKQLSQFLFDCGLSSLGLITGVEVDMITTIALGDGAEDGDDYLSCFDYVKHGAALAVIWVDMFDEAELVKVKEELQNNQIKRWDAVGMLKHVFSCVNLPWQLKKDAINFLLCIMEENGSHKCHDEHNNNKDYSHYIPSFYASLQAVQMVIIYAADTALRKNAFDAFKRVLADIPPSPRFDILVALIKNNESSSMIAILLGCVKDEMLMEIRQRVSMQIGVLQSQKIASQDVFFWRPGVLEVVELVLRPSRGGPPSLPEYVDAVLSALNLYRFVLITESTGKTNYTGVLSKIQLQKAYNEWLIPLRTLVSGIVTETHYDCNDLPFDALCALNPLELVLYRCIELVEENLKHCS